MLVGYADGCTAACATGGAQNFDALATIARQTGGPRLFAAYDARPDLTVGPAKATRSGGKVTLSVTVRNIGAARAKGVTVTFANGSTVLGTTKAVPIGAHGFAVLRVTTTKLPRGSAVITAIVDPAQRIAESNEGNNKSRTQVRT